MEKMYIQRPPLGLERCFLQNLFSRIVLNPRQKPHLSDKQTHLSSFQSPTVWLTFQPSCPSTYQLNLFLTILYQTKAVSWEISGHPHRRGASHSGTACRLQEASSGHLSPCVSRLHQACRHVWFGSGGAGSHSDLKKFLNFSANIETLGISCKYLDF